VTRWNGFSPKLFRWGIAAGANDCEGDFLCLGAFLNGKADILVAVTDLNLAQDQKLAETVPEIDLILGGHEHENIQQWRGSDFTPLFKADANVRTGSIARGQRADGWLLQNAEINYG
jgi:hypothetical protein